MNENNNIGNNDLAKALANTKSQLCLEILNELKIAEAEDFNYWMHWHHRGKTFDVNVFNDGDVIVFQAYPTTFDGQCFNTNTRKIVAETQLNWHVWKAMAAAMVLPTHNVELTVTLRIDVAIQSLSPGEATERAIKKFNDGNLDVIHALEHCECRAKITDDIPPIGDNCYEFNLLESLSKNVRVYAPSAIEAEDHLKNYIDTHVKLDINDSIGIDVLSEE